jgi:hypothetical protein
VHDVVCMEVIDGVKDLSNGFGSVFLGVSSLFTDPIEELSTSRKLCDYVVFILRLCSARVHRMVRHVSTYS